MSSRKWWPHMRVEMEIVRIDDRFEGTLAESGSNVTVPFCGVLELIAALEQLDQVNGGSGGDGPATGLNDFSGARSGDG